MQPGCTVGERSNVHLGTWRWRKSRVAWMLESIHSPRDHSIPYGLQNTPSISLCFRVKSYNNLQVHLLNLLKCSCPLSTCCQYWFDCNLKKDPRCVASIYSYYCAVSTPLDRSKALYTSPPGRLLIPTPTRLLREEFSHAAITTWRLLIYMSTAIYSHVLINTAQWTEVSCREHKCPAS